MPSPICLWSGPRNVSTALMYSFAQRDDVRVLDEPLYGHYLRLSGARHPGRDEVLATVNCDGDAVMATLLDEAAATSLHLFAKHMAHHLIDIDRGFLDRTRNILLVRDPQEMLPSLTIQLPEATLADTGLEQQWLMFEALAAGGKRPAVVDSRELLTDPASVLKQLCGHLDLPFDDTMLSWPAGGRPEDGVWAPHWYHAVHRSTGFEPYRPKKDFPHHLQPLLDDCRPWYDRLYRHALRA